MVASSIVNLFLKAHALQSTGLIHRRGGWLYIIWLPLGLTIPKFSSHSELKFAFSLFYIKVKLELAELT